MDWDAAAVVKKRTSQALLVLCGCFAARPVAAQEETFGDTLAAVEVHGFVSQGFILSTHNDYLTEDSTKGSFEFSEMGINFTKQLTDSLRTGVQFFAQDLGAFGNYDVQVDWFYLDYRWRDWLALRAGRLKIPYGLHNEIQDIDSARVPVLLPQSVYPLQTRQILFAQTGAELYGFARSDLLGALNYRLFGGTMFIDSEQQTPPGAGFDSRIRVPYVVGGRLLWETPLDGLAIAGSLQFLRLDATFFIPGIDPLVIENRSRRWVGSIEYGVGDWLFTGEYSRWYANQESTDPAISPPLEGTSERAYVMASYAVIPWLHPSVYYALFFPDVSNRSGKENMQHDVAATLRFDVNEHWLVKLEGHYMSGTAGLLNPLRINPPDLSTAQRNWTAFFLKTTAHF